MKSRTIFAIGVEVRVKGWTPRRVLSSCRTVGTHAHPSFREWSDWLKAQYLVR